jgi:hypothetical protein
VETTLLAIASQCQCFGQEIVGTPEWTSTENNLEAAVTLALDTEIFVLLFISVEI